MKPYGEVVGKVLKALEECGPMTRVEIECIVGLPKGELSPIVSRMNKPTPKSGKRIHITAWSYDAESERRYPRAIYALGDGKDVKKPKEPRIEIRRRYDAKRKLKYTTNSVFNLGKTREQIKAERRGM